MTHLGRRKSENNVHALSPRTRNSLGSDHGSPPTSVCKMRDRVGSEKNSKGEKVTTVLEVQKMLDHVAELTADICAIQAAYDAVRAEILAPVQEALDALESEYSPRFEKLKEAKEQELGKIKEAVLEFKSTISGDLLQAVYSV